MYKMSRLHNVHNDLLFFLAHAVLLPIQMVEIIVNSRPRMYPLLPGEKKI